MSNNHDLLAEIRQHNLLVPLVQRRIIADAVRGEQLSEKDLEIAKMEFFQKNGLTDNNAVQDFICQQELSAEDLEWQISLPLRIQSHLKSSYRHKAESLFLSKKEHLDTVVYSLLRTKDAFLAQELYLRIDSGESSFGDLASEFSEGPERETKGLVGPVPMRQAHPIVAEILRTSKPGALMSPIQVAEWWLIMQLENYKPATFDDAMADKLSRQLFDDWVNQEVKNKMKKSSPSDISSK